MPLYIKFDKLQGDVTDKNYKGFSQLTNMIFSGVANGVTNTVGKADYHRGSLPQFSPIQVFKSVDSISPYLLTAATSGHVYKEVTIVDTSTSKNSEVPFLTTTLKNVRIAHYAKTHASSGHHREMICLTYSSITETMSGKHANGSAKTQISAGFDLEKIQAL